LVYEVDQFVELISDTLPFGFALGHGERLTTCIPSDRRNVITRTICDKPSRRFTDIPRLKRILTDVFSCQLEDMEFDTFIDTMFKLLPRDERMSRDSELSDRTVTLETIDRLFDRF
jgi:hypothetical protein